MKLINLFIRITPNNIIISVNSAANKPLYIVTGGQITPKLKGRKKVSKVAAKMIGELTSKWLKAKRCKAVIVHFFGNKKNRKTILKEFWKSKILIYKIIDLTPVPHNGCRLKKRKRI